MIPNHKMASQLKSEDTVVAYRDEANDHLYFASSWSPQVSSLWQRVPARVIESEEVSTGRWRLRFFVGARRYTVQCRSSFYFESLPKSLPKHHPVCIECIEPWPCREHRQDIEAQRMADELNCNHCGKSIGAAWSVTVLDGDRRRRFHIARKYRGTDGRRCKDVAAEAGAVW